MSYGSAPVRGIETGYSCRDPVFNTFDGQSFEFHGGVGKTYNVFPIPGECLVRWNLPEKAIKFCRGLFDMEYAVCQIHMFTTLKDQIMLSFILFYFSL